MTQYAILIYGDDAAYADMSQEAWAAMMDAHEAFAKAVPEQGGSIVSGEGLSPAPTATSVREGGVVTDGPFVETKESLGGFYIIEADDLDHAVRLAGLCPAPAGGVEVRPVMVSSGDGSGS